MEIIQVVSVGIIGAILSIVLKKQNAEMSMFIGICTGVIIFIFIASKLEEVIDVLREMGNTAGINLAYIGIVLKVIGIAYIAQFGAELCADAGENSIASKIELAGKVLIMVVSAPILLALMDLVMNMAV